MFIFTYNIAIFSCLPKTAATFCKVESLFAEKAGDLMAVAFFFELRDSVFAVFHTLGAAVVKIAPGAFFRR